ncbi:pyrophosphatase PpaX [Cerasibacillus terrae]|uniref:Pyrophosphatase PpaX n=1 Tax=Cerasibacillus terrae TaxID=2498845 RepID=A0A5C8NUY4_9BACI|nr:pyrophosphatase PpaX [Cerasibacillus terrae]TXL64984.1 pyrophosphatase PpaX [Cerasibacillus terrae]
MNIDTILFDLDGTLIDTNELIIKSFRYTFEQYGYEFTLDEIKSFNGPPLFETFTKINKDKAEDMMAMYRKHNLAHHDTYVKTFPNVIETIIQLKGKVKIAIVTNKMKKSVQKGMEITNLSPHFDTIVTLDDVTHAKPHPEPVIKAMQLIGAKPETTLMVGDNYHDIEAGQRAGVKTAGVNWSHKGREFLEGYNPTYMIDDMLELLELIGG